jgi:uncharacterized protein (DUF2267 family)
MNFESYVINANKFLKDVAIEIGEPDNRAKAGRVLKAVLHILRTRFTAEESIHFAGQLPILIKGIYVDGWHLTRFRNNPDNNSDLLTDIKSFEGNWGYNDFSNDAKTIDMIRGVLRVLKRSVKDGEVQSPKSHISEEINDVIFN